MNKASLDFYDFTTGIYERDVFKRANPEVVLGLGDVGNDIQLYGSKLYVVVNASNKVEVLDVHTAKRIKQIEVLNCRYIAFDQGKAYVSSYNSKIDLDSNSPYGEVVEIDTTTLMVTREVTVGRQPEGLAVVGRKLYVANSGGYNPSNYEHTVSVINLDAFKEIKRIEVGINLDQLKADRYGNIWVNSRGDYQGKQANFFMINTKTEEVSYTFNKAVSNFWIDQDNIYTYSSEWNYQTQKNTISYQWYALADSHQGMPYITDGTEKEIALPYGIAVDPHSKDIYLTDAKNYVTPGTLYRFSANGKLIDTFETGDIPAHMVFLGL
ncbi:hypothetical protein GCM10023231_14930 [Olivibacter ginsenosidimutans]|uniref:YncE family protein n=2 Tax=Olivibacter ginsenosidimutans TaxID=1176537 RepID=A0ABP9AYK6_9SPHI